MSYSEASAIHWITTCH